MLELIGPYKRHDAELRKVFAQQPDHVAIREPNVVPVFAGHEDSVRIRARKLDIESQATKESYIMPLKEKDRKANGSLAIVPTLRDFRNNLNVFSESSLVDMDWSNVVVAGSAVVTSLLSVPEPCNASKAALRKYYHEQIAPASDVDLFLYGLTEDQTIEKIKSIERSIKDALLVETTTIRTKNAVTIASRYPTRHVQIVLRMYKSISEILTGFDVDCSCAAYDGTQVWASPRALAAYMTQINTIDLTRRSPSYENRLSKYSHRGFEVYWPNLDRSMIDPTIYERSFGRTQGLARLLILEKLPKSSDRDAYVDQRRRERGRPPVNRFLMNDRMIGGNIKDDHEDEVAEFVDAEEVSNYHTFTIPYGPRFHARKIEKLLYTKDLLLNAEWNKPKDREVHLHRHPAFFGTMEDVIQDCCGYCPEPSTVEEEEVAEEESKVFIKGDLTFLRDNPGRQAIGSFNPLTADDWTEMAYVSNTAMLCQAIVDADAEYVRAWAEKPENDVNARDWTGRTPLHLAVANSTPETVQALIDHGARIVARLVDGKTALHLACIRGSVEIVSALLRKSEANEEENEKKIDAKRTARKAAKHAAAPDVEMGDAQTDHPQRSAVSDEESDVDMVEDADEDEDMDATTEHSMVHIKEHKSGADANVLPEDDEDEPDIYDVNVTAWDVPASPLHFAIVNGHVDVVRCLVSDFGADVLLPVKLFNDHDKSARAAILTLVPAFQLPRDKAEAMIRTLIDLGASSAQADINQCTALQYCVADTPDLLQTLIDADKPGFKRALNHCSASGAMWNLEVASPLSCAVNARDGPTALRLLELGAKADVSFDAYTKAWQVRRDLPPDSQQNKRNFEMGLQQPIICAVERELVDVAKALLDRGVDPNTLTTEGYRVLHDEYTRRYTRGKSLLDVVEQKLGDLEGWRPEEPRLEVPIPLKEDDSYLSGYSDNSYRLWSAQEQLQAAKDGYKAKLQMFEQARDQSSTATTFAAAKQSAVRAMAESFQQLRALIVEKGGRKFYELHEDVQEPEKRNGVDGGNDGNKKPQDFHVDFTFRLPDASDEVRDRYVDLFEATWRADVETMKTLTLLPWTDSDGEQRPPLKVAVQDQHGLFPFAIAVMQGQYDLAKTIMEIAHAQYVPPDFPKQQQYKVGGEASEYDSDDETDEDVHLHSEIVDDKFTVETIGEVSLQVESRVTALDMLRWSCPASAFLKQLSTTPGGSGFSYFGPRKSNAMFGERFNPGSVGHASPPSTLMNVKLLEDPQNLFQLSLFNGDTKLLVYLLELGREYMQRENTVDHSRAAFFTFNDSDFSYALAADKPALVEEIITRTGAGIPLNELVKKSGVEIKEKPKYYQGLSVHGSKRKDWADAGRNANHEPAESQRPPLLEAAHLNSLKLVEWFLCDAPIRCYKAFAETNKDDKRLQRLAEAEGGLEASISRFLQARCSLVIHSFLLSSCIHGNYDLLKYLLSAMPSALDAKSNGGLTPLAIAYRLYDATAAKLLIEAGADQACRDKTGKNILHHLLAQTIDSRKMLGVFEEMIKLIDARLLPTLFLERCSDQPGSLTPFARWLDVARSQSYGDGLTDAETCGVIIRLSKGAELTLINGEGDTPLHVAVKRSEPHPVQAILGHDQTLLDRENATGRTPFEMAHDSAMTAMCEDAPPLPNDYRFRARQARRLERPEEWVVNVTERNAQSFVDHGKKDCRTDQEKVYDIVRKVKSALDAEKKAKRRLVTLNEANEVARRLAAKNAGRVTEHQGGVSGTEEVDEVQIWLSSAKVRA